ncbi:Uncharacterised protein [Escherichia coli]|nr:Uncharacterised protein [Escherichia coli]
MFFAFKLPELPGPGVMQGRGMHAFTFPMLTFLVSVDSGFQGIDEAGYHSRRPLLPVHPGDADQPAMPSDGDEHPVRAAPSHEYVAARRGVFVGHG